MNTVTHETQKRVRGKDKRSTVSESEPAHSAAPGLRAMNHNEEKEK